MRDARGETNPNMHEQHDNAKEEQLEHPVELQEVPAEPTRRSTRETRPIERLEPKMSGKLYMQEQKKVNFECDAQQELEYHHNLIKQNEPDEGQSKEYSPSDAMLMARLIYDLTTRVVREGATFAQQCLLNKGLKIFGQKGRDASKKEMDQLHQRSCFTPKSIAKIKSDRTKKGATSADVPGRKARRNRKRENGLQWKANQRMAIKRGLCESNSSIRKHYANISYRCT
jgi:hypothetical protein